jgi:hypothetical protein
MKPRSFEDPVTGAILHVADMDTEVSEQRLWWGRKLGYTDDEIRSMWLRDARRPRYLDLTGFERIMTKAQADRFEAQRRITGI